MRALRALLAHYRFLHQQRAFPENLSPKAWDLLCMILRDPAILNPKLKGSLLDLPRPVAFEKTSTGYLARVPNLPGCTATGGTIKSTLLRVKAAIAHQANLV